MVTEIQLHLERTIFGSSPDLSGTSVSALNWFNSTLSFMVAKVDRPPSLNITWIKCTHCD
jgi:hypothetical protein